MAYTKRRQTQASQIPLVIGLCLGVAAVVAWIVVSSLNQAEPPAVIKQAQPPATPHAAPPPAKSRQELADEESRKLAEDFQRKLQALPEPRDNGKSIAANAVPREQFTDNVMYKTEKEVLDLYGPPYTTSESTGGPTLWIYRRRTYDTLTQKPDFSANVFFGDDGHVRRVTF